MWIQKVGGGSVDLIAYSPDGRTIYTLDRGRTLIAWEVATHARRVLGYTSSATLHLPQNLVALADGKRLVGVGSSTVVVWDVADGKELRKVERPKRPVAGDPVCVTADGRAYFLDESATVIVGWNLTTGEPEPARTAPGLSSFIHNFDLSPDGKSIAVVFRGETVLFDWDEQLTVQQPGALPSAWAVRFSPGSRTLAISNSAPPRISLWDIPTRQPRFQNVTGWITEAFFAFNPVLPVFADLNRGYGCNIISTQTGEVIRSLDFAQGKQTRCVTFSPDGLTCAVGGSNKQFVVFDVDV